MPEIPRPVDEKSAIPATAVLVRVPTKVAPTLTEAVITVLLSLVTVLPLTSRIVITGLTVKALPEAKPDAAVVTAICVAAPTTVRAKDAEATAPFASVTRTVYDVVGLATVEFEEIWPVLVLKFIPVGSVAVAVLLAL